jgi:hypothetical protein
MSSNNVLLHFPPNSPDKVYIGICDWAMAGNFNDLKESLYIHESQEARNRIMQHRWWVAPELNYVLPPLGNTRDVDFEWQPKFTPKSETYVVGRIAHWIYGGNLSLKYFSKQHKVNRGDDRSPSQQRIKPSNVVWSSYLESDCDSLHECSI